MLNAETRKLVNRLSRDYGVARVYSIINSVVVDRKDAEAYNLRVVEALNSQFKYPGNEG